jgi:Ca2+-binding EF-hand superfamily protein
MQPVHLRPFLAWTLILGVVPGAGAAPQAPRPAPVAAKPGAPRQRTAEELFREYDRNHDGFLSREELPPRLRDHFAEYDLDRDGKWGLDDFRRALVELSQRRAPAERVRTLLQTSGHDAEARQELQRIYDAIRVLDVNRDGTISRNDLRKARRRVVEQRVDRLLKEQDRDHDGRISRQEAQGELLDEFAEIDRDRDGFLSREELLRAAEQPSPRAPAGSAPDPAARQFADYDKNHDGFLTPDELPEQLREPLLRFDLDRDGRLNLEEFRRGLAALQSERRHSDWVFDLIETAERDQRAPRDLQRTYRILWEVDRNHDGVLDGRELADARRRLIEKEVDALFKEYDTNQDGKISKEEAAQGALSRSFGEMDLNKDGYLTRDELRHALRDPEEPPN